MLIGYFARPVAQGNNSGVLVCHENRGLTEHIKDVTRRAAKAGYAALAVDLLSRSGGTELLSTPNQASGLLGNAPQEQFVGDFRSGWGFLKGLPYVRKDSVGMVGFCFGGGVTWLAAVGIPELRAAVPFYGPAAPLSDVPKINANVLAMYGENDQRINSGIPGIEDAMKKSGKTFEKMIYPGAGHAFHNDTGSSYRADAARDAWQKTLAWFDRYLKV
ncbi:MAG: dienelactone hydrolase family protein [Dehalococcoidia bacterium]|nr:dienelactone hydrolase family protein [Dehalococcoidia bacterium]